MIWGYDLKEFLMVNGKGCLVIIKHWKHENILHDDLYEKRDIVMN